VTHSPYDRLTYSENPYRKAKSGNIPYDGLGENANSDPWSPRRTTRGQKATHAAYDGVGEDRKRPSAPTTNEGKTTSDPWPLRRTRREHRSDPWPLRRTRSGQKETHAPYVGLGEDRMRPTAPTTN
jgi:hypothetical protein